MFLSRISTTLLRPTTPATFSWSRSLSSQVNEAVNATVTSSSAKEDKIVMAKKTNIAQSPLRMKFLARLVRGTWVPDAMAQMKFSPKHRAEDVLKIIQRANAIAQINYGAIPEELMVKEILVNKGSSMKKLRIMGRGRTGVGMIRKTHITVKLEVINFEEKIEDAETQTQKKKWALRRDMVNKLKNNSSTAVTTTTTTSA